jgi:osomolarity two-component system, sensor histidine kinase NIK1
MTRPITPLESSVSEEESLSDTETENERTRIIALTASALESDVRRCLEAGADLHLSKPIKKRVLLSAVEATQLDSTAAAA